MPFFTVSEAPPRPEIDEIPCKLPASREFGIFRDEFAADSPLQQRVRCELDFLPGLNGSAGRPTEILSQVGAMLAGPAALFSPPVFSAPSCLCCPDPFFYKQAAEVAIHQE